MQHTGPIAGIASHGHLIATAGYDNRLILWDARRRQALARASHDHLVNQCSFSADGRWLLSAGSDYSARVWSLPSLRLHAVLSGHGDDVDMAVFSPDDTLIATCALDRMVRIFDRDGRCLHTLAGHEGNVLSVAWMADSRHLVSSSVDGTLRRWDARAGKQLAVTNLHVRTDSVEIGSGGMIYAGDDRGRIAVIDHDHVHFCQAHRAGIKKIVLDGQTLVSLSYDRSLAVWHIDAQQQLHELARDTLPADIWARAATILDDGRIATGSFGGSYALFDPRSGQWDLDGVVPGAAINAVLQHRGHCFTAGDAGHVCRDGVQIAAMGSLCNFLVATDDQLLCGGQLGQLFDAHSGRVLYQHHSPLNCAVALGDRQQIAVGSYTGEILVFAQKPHGWALQKTLPVYENAIKGLSYSDGMLFSVCASGAVAWHRCDDWSQQQAIRHAHQRIANDCCCIGPQQFASVSRDRQLRLWRKDSVESHDSPHPNSVKCIAANLQRTHVLSGSYGGTLALFDLQQRRWLPMLRPTMAGIADISWNDEAQHFIAASYDGQLYTVAIP